MLQCGTVWEVSGPGYAHTSITSSTTATISHVSENFKLPGFVRVNPLHVADRLSGVADLGQAWSRAARPSKLETRVESSNFEVRSSDTQFWKQLGHGPAPKMAKWG